MTSNFRTSISMRSQSILLATETGTWMVKVMSNKLLKCVNGSEMCQNRSMALTTKSQIKQVSKFRTLYTSLKKSWSTMSSSQMCKSNIMFSRRKKDYFIWSELDLLRNRYSSTFLRSLTSPILGRQLTNSSH